MSFTPSRNPTPRRVSDPHVVTVAWLQRWALGALATLFVGGLAAAWSLSAQVTDLKRDVQDAKATIPQVQVLTEEVRLLRKGQDSLITLMTDRERRSLRPFNPLRPGLTP